ncbi:MAG: glycosyltransferase family 4 protein [Proteobacteria bacterium]|nr:glycosyltransferase family 4 protein [Pseudomonadota bacterium]
MKRVLISSHTSFFPPEHGGAKSLRHVAESLAQSGVRVRVLIKMHPPLPERIRFAGQFSAELESFRGQFESWQPAGPHGGPAWTHRGVEYAAVAGESADLARASRGELESFAPDGFFLSDDSPEEGLDLFQVAADSGRFVFFAQTIHALPFGRYSIKPSEKAAAAIRKAVKIVAPSRFVQQYIQSNLGKDAVLLYPNVFGKPPFPSLGRFTNKYVTMINPCAWKGSSIFLKLARRRPEVAFAVVPTWGTVPPILEELKALKNVTLLPETPRIDDIFAQTRLLLTPSLCQEAFGLVSPEALLRGVPVVASDIAGLRESTLGVAALVPVVPLPFSAPPDKPFPFVDWQEPENDVEPWSRAIDRILATEEGYKALSVKGREAATRFVEGLQARSVLDVVRVDAATLPA